MLNTATSLISDVIGKDDQSSAFVYGAYSFFDKIANGGLLFVITAVWIDDATAVRWVIAVLPPICALIGCLLAFLGTRLYSSRLAKLSHMNNPKLSLQKKK